MSEAQANSGRKCDACAGGMRLQNGVLKGREKVAGSASEQVVANGNPMYVYILGAFRAFLQFKLKRRMFKGYDKVAPYPGTEGVSDTCVSDSKLAWLKAIGLNVPDEEAATLQRATAPPNKYRFSYWLKQLIALTEWQMRVLTVQNPIVGVIPVAGVRIPLVLPRRFRFYGRAALRANPGFFRLRGFTSFGAKKGDPWKECCELTQMGIMMLIPVDIGLDGHTYVICGVECDKTTSPPKCSYLVVSVTQNPLRYYTVTPTGPANPLNGDAIPVDLVEVNHEWRPLSPPSAPVPHELAAIESRR